MADCSRRDLRGLWVPIVTPFHEDGDVDLASLRRLADRLLVDGVTGLVALGTTGEPSTLTIDERLRVAETCAEACRAVARPLLVGAGSNSTAGTLEEIHRIADRVADHVTETAVLVVVPYYTRPSEQAIVEHFGLVADESPVPVVMYNIPYRTGRDVGAAALLEASHHRNIIGLKQSVGSLDRSTLEILAGCSNRLQLLAGDDAFIAPTILMGGVGAIAAAAHLCTPHFAAMVTAGLAGDAERAGELSASLLPVVAAGFAEPNPAVWKAALTTYGEISSATVRRPLTVASTDATQRLLTAVAGAAGPADWASGSPVAPVPAS